MAQTPNTDISIYRLFNKNFKKLKETSLLNIHLLKKIIKNLA